MANENHISASGLRGVDETLQRELDAVQAVYFPPSQEIYSSSDSGDECSDEEGSDALFERSAVLTPCDDGDEDPHENPEPSDVSNEVSDECIQMFLSTSCQCSLGLNGRPCSTLFSKATVLEMRYQCLELTADQLDMLILGRLDGHTKERVGMKRSGSNYFLRGHQVCRKTFLFVHCISKKRLFNLKCYL